MAFVPRIIPGGKIPLEEEDQLTRQSARDGLRLLCAFARIRSRDDRLKVIALAEEIAKASTGERQTESFY
jgi:hypothetical protein